MNPSSDQKNNYHVLIVGLLAVVILLLGISLIKQNRASNSALSLQERTALEHKVETLQQRLATLEGKAPSNPAPTKNTPPSPEPTSPLKNFKRNEIEFSYPSSWILETAELSHDGEFPPDQWEIKSGATRIGYVTCPSFALGAPRERLSSVNKEFQKNGKTFRAEFTILKPLSGNGSVSDPWTSFVEVFEKTSDDNYSNNSCMINANTVTAPNQALKEGLQKIYETLK